MLRKTIPKLSQIQINTLDRVNRIIMDKRSAVGVLYSNHKRHNAIIPLIRNLKKNDRDLSRRSVFDYISDFVKVVIPKIENFVEGRMLERFKLKLSNEEKVLVEDAYRQHKIHTTPPPELDLKQPNLEKDVSPSYNWEAIGKIWSDVEGNGISYHTFEDIGKYTVFPKKLQYEIFPFGFYGNYLKDEYKYTQRLGIMCREEGLRACHLFSNITTKSERHIPIEDIINFKYNFKRNLKHNQQFQLFFQDIALSLIELLHKYNNISYYRLFVSPDVFDGLITVLVRSMEKNYFGVFMAIPETRQKILEQLVGMIHEKYSGLEHPLQHFRDIIEDFNNFKIFLQYNDIHEYCLNNGIKIDEKLYPKNDQRRFVIYLKGFYDICYYQWRPPDVRYALENFKGFNTGLLLNGPSGVGKSQIMAYMHAWARENGWVVVAVPSARKFTHDMSTIERHGCGLFLQHDLVREFLLEFKIINYKILKDTPVNYKLYGKSDFAGNRDGDPDPVPVVWDKDREVFTDSWRQFLPKDAPATGLHPLPDHNKRAFDINPKPKNLLEIVNIGTENGRFSTSAFSEILYQLYRSDTLKTMILIDEYNEWFRYSDFSSLKYGNHKNARIPPYDFAFCRLMMKFDGHMIKNGVKVCASSMTEHFNSKFDPKMINFPKKYDITVENLRLNDARNAIYYYMNNKMGNRNITDMEIEFMIQLSQGNWRDLQKDLIVPLRLRPLTDDWLFRKKLKALSKIKDY